MTAARRKLFSCASDSRAAESREKSNTHIRTQRSPDILELLTHFRPIDEAGHKVKLLWTNLRYLLELDCILDQCL